MKRTPYIILSILCVAAMSCASTDTNDQVIAGNAMESPSEQVASAEEDQRKNKPGAPQATKPEEMHGHSMNATGVSTMTSASDRKTTTTVNTTNNLNSNSTTQVDATLTPVTTDTSVPVGGQTTPETAGNVDLTATPQSLNTNTTTTTTTTSSGNMTSSTNLDTQSSTNIDDDDDDTTTSTTTESRRRMRKD